MSKVELTAIVLFAVLMALGPLSHGMAFTVLNTTMFAGIAMMLAAILMTAVEWVQDWRYQRKLIKEINKYWPEGV